jgi:protease I
MQAKLAGKRVAILATDGFEQSELLEPLKALRKAGALVQVVSLEPGQIQGMKHADKGEKVDVDLVIDDARETDFSGLVLPGGVANPDRLRTNAKAVKFVGDFFRTGKPVGAICHGPWTLIEADVVRGRKLTSWPSLKTDLTNAGAHWVDQEAVVDGKLVTSRNPDDLPAFCECLIDLLNAHDPTSKAQRPGRLEEMLARKDLSDEVKQKILHEWERDARALSRAENEGMVGDVESHARLDEIQHTRRKLERTRTQVPRAQPKPH